ncbi:MAG: ATP-binding protein [Verrucomicrobiota bacterium]
MTEDKSGNLFFGNEKGVLKYDGAAWSILPSTGDSVFTQAVMVDHMNRIWAMGNESIGYYEAGKMGDYVYVDMLPSLKTYFEVEQLGPFWELFAMEETIYLATSYAFLSWDGSIWSKFSFNTERRILPSDSKGKFYIHSRGEGIFRFDNEEWKKVAGPNSLYCRGIDAIVEKEDDVLTLFTFFQGTLEIDLKTQEVRKVQTPFEESAQGKMVTAINGTDSSSVLAGVSTVGLYFIDNQYQLSGFAADPKNNMYDNYAETSSGYWATASEELLQIPFGTALSHYETGDRVDAITRFSDKIVFAGRYYLFELDPSNAPEKSTVQRKLEFTGSYTLTEADKHLITGGTEDCLKINSDGSIDRIESPRQILSSSPSRLYPETVYAGDLPFVSRIRKQADGEWQLVDSSAEPVGFVLALEELPDGSVLATTQSGPVKRIFWPENGSGPPRVEPLGKEQGLPEEFAWSYVLHSQGHYILVTDQGAFRYAFELERFEYDDVLGSDLGLNTFDLEYTGLASGDGWLLWLPENEVSGQRLGALSISTDGSLNWEPWYIPALSELGNVESLYHEVYQGTELLWIGGLDALHRYDLDAMPETPPRDAKVTSVRELNSGALFQGPAGSAQLEMNLKFPQERLAFRVTSPPSRTELVGFQTRLLGFEKNWSETTELQSREYTRISEGNYTFEVRAIDEFLRAGPIASYSFTILPPWYRTVYAYLCYVLMLFLFILVAARIRTNRLHRKNLELEATVADRTEELQRKNEQLRQANTVKQDFLASMSHEIRNPLNGILGVAQLLRQEQVGGATRISHLNACATHLHQLLGQVLDFSSLESGKLETRPKPFDVNELIEEAVGMYSALAEKKALQISKDFKGSDNLWIGDPVLLRQVLINLISNAIKYTPSGEVRVQLEYAEASAKVEARFIIEDTGPGIPEDKREYIFKDFTRLNKAGESEIAGTGLGLAIASQMSELMRGSLTLDPSYQEGARFVLALPFEGGAKIVEKTAETFATTQPLTGKRVLVADDMEFNRYISRELVQKLGAEVDEAEDGQEALEALNRDFYDIALLDINMPKMNGNQVVQAFLRKPSGRPTLFVALTAHVTASMEKAAFQAGFSHFIEKPLDPEVLMQIAQAQPLRDKKAAADLLSYLSGSDSKAQSKLKDRYLQSMREQIKMLSLALDHEDRSEASKILHKLRGLANLKRKKDMIEIMEQLAETLHSDEDILIAKKQFAKLGEIFDSGS